MASVVGPLCVELRTFLKGRRLPGIADPLHSLHRLQSGAQETVADTRAFSVVTGDFNSWAEGGATGWSYADVLPYFRKSEGLTHPVRS